ncbi:MAG TPA: GerMN domain-containing protein [Acidimicrobiales bacterium]
MRRASLAAAVLAIAVVTLAAACGVPSDETYSPIARADVPFGLADSTTTSTTLAPTTTTTLPEATTTTILSDPVKLYFTLGGRLIPVVRVLPRPVLPQEVLVELQQGPDEEDLPEGLRSAVPRGMLVRVAVVGGTAQVDLAKNVVDLSGTEQVLAFGQVVATLTERPGIGRVAFTIEGAPVIAPRGDGSLGTESVACDDYLALLPADAPCRIAAPPTTTTSPVPVPATGAPVG